MVLEKIANAMRGEAKPKSLDDTEFERKCAENRKSCKEAKEKLVRCFDAIEGTNYPYDCAVAILEAYKNVEQVEINLGDIKEGYKAELLGAIEVNRKTKKTEEENRERDEKLKKKRKEIIGVDGEER